MEIDPAIGRWRPAHYPVAGGLDHLGQKKEDGRSFLVKDLHLPWQWGARHFLRYLADGDLASNNHGWQWCAGTGTDAAPYFRVFNPTAQGRRFDPDGDYVRRWVPELAPIEGAAVHEPGLRRPDVYPAPMIDHAVERADALARYRNAKAGSR